MVGRRPPSASRLHERRQLFPRRPLPLLYRTTWSRIVAAFGDTAARNLELLPLLACALRVRNSSCWPRWNLDRVLLFPAAVLRLWSSAAVFRVRKGRMMKLRLRVAAWRLRLFCRHVV
jgi:hypothetical protein